MSTIFAMWCNWINNTVKEPRVGFKSSAKWNYYIRILCVCCNFQSNIYFRFILLLLFKCKYVRLSRKQMSFPDKGISILHKIFLVSNFTHHESNEEIIMQFIYIEIYFTQTSLDMTWKFALGRFIC